MSLYHINHLKTFYLDADLYIHLTILLFLSLLILPISIIFWRFTFCTYKMFSIIVIRYAHFIKNFPNIIFRYIIKTNYM